MGSVISCKFFLCQYATVKFKDVGRKRVRFVIPSCASYAESCNKCDYYGKYAFCVGCNDDQTCEYGCKNISSCRNIK